MMHATQNAAVILMLANRIGFSYLFNAHSRHARSSNSFTFATPNSKRGD